MTYLPEEFAELGSFIVVTNDDDRGWRYVPVTRNAELTPEQLEELGLVKGPEKVEGFPLATEFCLPMKNLDKPWYEAAHDPRFGEYNGHPRFAHDWNLETGGDSDLGEPLVAPWTGVVINARQFGGSWGRIMRILGHTAEGETIVWMGAHLQAFSVEVGEIVKVGQDIGRIGNANGQYPAHLHEQICVGAVPGPTVFGTDRRYNFVHCSNFYIEHGVDEEVVKHAVYRDQA
jgi:hypothetical protein